MDLEAKYSIQMASKLTGIGVHTLRKWESRYKLINPIRDKGGRRIYNEKEIEKLQLLNELTTLGESIGHLKDRSFEELKGMAQKISKSENKIPDIELSKPNLKEMLVKLLWALEHYRLEIISHELDKLNIMLSKKDLVSDVFQPLLTEVGKRVLSGTLSFAQELALHSIIRLYLAKLINQNQSKKSKSTHNVIIASPEGDNNDFPLLLSCLLMEHHEVKYYYLGTNIPPEAILEAARALESTDIIIGLSPMTLEQNKKSFESQLRVLKKGKGMNNIHILGHAQFKFENENSSSNIRPLKNLNSLLQKLEEWRS